MSALYQFWKFTRPHTVIGSALSVGALYLMATPQPSWQDTILWISLFSALSCNVFITGYNQVVDVQLDKINKPSLPLASGKISLPAGKIIVFVSLILSLVSAWFVSGFLFGLIGVVAIFGFLYSWKRVFLKQHHTTAALAITVVRGVLVNVGFYLHFSGMGTDFANIPSEIWLLVVFVSLFSLGIAWFKDIPDVKGDAGARIQTLVVINGIQKTYRIGVYTVALGYVVSAFAPMFVQLHLANSGLLTVGHGMLGLAFLSAAFRINPENPEEIKKFYKIFWVFFFLEYVLFAAAFWF